MPTVIRDTGERRKRALLPAVLSDLLPPRLLGEICEGSMGCGDVEEIRCRLFLPTFRTVGKKNTELTHVTTETDMKQMTEAIFGSSPYAYRESMAEGYLTRSGGVRVGICGRAFVEGGRIKNIFDVRSLCFRLPSHDRRIDASALQWLRGGRSILVYSPPGEGKTTFLRSVIGLLSSGASPLRVSVVDSRGELQGVHGNADVMVGYPKSVGIEIATRTQNPQVIICDEIGDGEASAIISAANCGVPLLMSTHGDGLSRILRRRGIAELHRAAVFDIYIGLSRDGRGGFEYSATSWESANELL